MGTLIIWRSRLHLISATGGTDSGSLKSKRDTPSSRTIISGIVGTTLMQAVPGADTAGLGTHRAQQDRPLEGMWSLPTESSSSIHPPSIFSLSPCSASRPSSRRRFRTSSIPLLSSRKSTSLILLPPTYPSRSFRQHSPTPRSTQSLLQSGTTKSVSTPSTPTAGVHAKLTPSFTAWTASSSSLGLMRPRTSSPLHIPVMFVLEASVQPTASERSPRPRSVRLSVTSTGT